MRNLAFALLFASTSALACPNLAGTYAVCSSTDSSDSTDMIVEQKAERGVTTYSFSSIDAETHERSTDIYVANGKTQTLNETDPDTGLNVKIVTTATCNGTRSLNVKMKIYIEGELFSDLASTVTKSGSSMKMETTGKLMGEAVKETTVCR
jgi:hypothetical protein